MSITAVEEAKLHVGSALSSPGNGSCESRNAGHRQKRRGKSYPWIKPPCNPFLPETFPIWWGPLEKPSRCYRAETLCSGSKQLEVGGLSAGRRSGSKTCNWDKEGNKGEMRFGRVCTPKGPSLPSCPLTAREREPGRAGQGLGSRLCPRRRELHRAGHQEDGVSSRVILPGNRQKTLQPPSTAQSPSPRAAPLPCPSNVIQQSPRDKCDSGISLSTGRTAGNIPFQEAELIFLAVQRCSSSDQAPEHSVLLLAWLLEGCQGERGAVGEAAGGDCTPSPHLL